jgi:predicted porin
MTYQYASVPVAARGRDVIGGGVLLRTPVEGLKIGASAYTMRLYGSVAGAPLTKLSDERQKAYAGAVEYLTDKISLRSEVLLTRGYEVDDTVYVEAAYKLTPHWQVAGTFEYLRFKEPAAVVASLDKHRAFGGALNYWVNPNVVFKLDYYRVDYNRVARPSDAVNRALAGTLPKTTDVVIGGVQFAF